MSNLKEIDPDTFTTLSEFDEAIEWVAEEYARIEMQITSAKGDCFSIWRVCRLRLVCPRNHGISPDQSEETEAR